MKILSARISEHEDPESGLRPGYVTMELREDEVRDMIRERVATIERGCGLWTAEHTLGELKMLRSGIDLVKTKRGETP